MFGGLPFGSGYFGQASQGGVFVSPIPGVLNLIGEYAPTIDLIGDYQTTFDVTGEYRTTIDITGEVE